MLEAFLNIHFDKSDGGVTEQPWQWAQESAEQEQVTTELPKLTKGPSKKEKEGSYWKTVNGVRANS